MAKLYPPTINENIPAFYKDKDGTVKITVPFSMNKAVLKSDIEGFILKIKTVQGNIQLGTKSIPVNGTSLDKIIENKEVTFFINEYSEALIEKLRIGQFLKVQMAYLGANSEIGYYSTVGITKYTSKPILSIQGFEEIKKDDNYKINSFPSEIIGQYALGEDKTERPYSYKFILWEKGQEKPLEETDWLLYNNLVNNTSNSLDITTIKHSFSTVSEPEKEYNIQFIVRTINNLEVSSPIYECKEINIEELLPEESEEIEINKFNFILNAENIFEEGYINLSFGIDENKVFTTTEKPIYKNEPEWELAFIQGYSHPTKFDMNNNFISSGYKRCDNANNDSYDNDHYKLIDGYKPDRIVTPGCVKIIIYKYEQGGSNPIYKYHNSDILYTRYTIATFYFYYDQVNGDLCRIEYKKENDPRGLLYLDYAGLSTAASFEICRKELKSSWKVIQRVSFNNIADVTQWNFKDFSVEQGVPYQYAFRQYNKAGIYSNFKFSKEKNVVADFEDMFLCDDEKQIKIRFNPKVPSLKINRQESKIDTLGSKYPFIFRNSIIEYKEFPISGLISYYLDENEEFIKDIEDELGILLSNKMERQKNPAIEIFSAEEEYIDITVNDIFNYENIATTNLTNYNMKAERKFKLKLLDWLGNGKVKLFKSPAEGNCFVRLLNVSLSPEDKVSRMIHNFSCTAYEVMDYNYNNLVNLGYYNLANNNVGNYIGDIENIDITNIVENLNINGPIDGSSISDDDWKTSDKYTIKNNQFIIFNNDKVIIPTETTEKKKFFTDIFTYNAESKILKRYILNPLNDNTIIQFEDKDNDNTNMYFYTKQTNEQSNWFFRATPSTISIVDGEMQLNNITLPDIKDWGFTFGKRLSLNFINYKIIEITISKKESD